MLAIALKRPALALEPAEAEKLEDAFKRVWRHYPLNVSQKQVDMAFAATVVVEIYGTRIAAAYMDSGTQAPVKQADPTVLPFFKIPT
jgi:hypothetical protein